MNPSAKPHSLWLITFLLSAGTALNGCAFTAKSGKKLLDNSKDIQFDAIVVPGVPFQNGKWDRVMKARVYWSKYLYDKGIAKNIIYSGSSVYSPYYEGKIMALYAEAIGIPRAHIFTEIKAEHSTENIYYSYQKARQLGFKKIALASDPFQTKMLTQFTFSKVSPEIAFLPIIFDTLKAMEPQMKDPEINYQEAYNKDFVSIISRQNFWERFQGTLGNKLDTTAYHN